MYLISKAILYKQNGDQQIIKQKISTPDLEQVRRELKDSHQCKSVEFVYEDDSIQIPVHNEN